ncbi:MAG: 5-formyltetrahydrofolate cyclo-ligase [Phycisphaerae bacterium]
MIKKALRQELRRIVASIPPEQIRQRSLRACDRLVRQPEYRKAEVVMVFLSLPSEIDTAPLVLRAWQDRKRVLAPKVSWQQRRMLPIGIRSLQDDVAVSSAGLREPVDGEPFPVSEIDLVIVPGLGFDPFGHRLGRGRGFYDRFLGQPDFHGTSCAMAFEEQFVDMIPAGPYDVPIDMLVTDRAVRRFHH